MQASDPVTELDERIVGSDGRTGDLEVGHCLLELQAWHKRLVPRKTSRHDATTGKHATATHHTNHTAAATTTTHNRSESAHLPAQLIGLPPDLVRNAAEAIGCREYV